MKLKNKLDATLLSWKRKLFFEDNYMIDMIFSNDSGVKSMKNAWRLAEGMNFNNIKFIRRNPQNNLLILKNQEGTYIAIDENFCVFDEVFLRKAYDFDNHYFEAPFRVFDFGLNRGYTSLFFAQHKNCKKVFGYEPDKENFDFAQYNRSLNPHLQDKMEFFNYGVGKKDETVNLHRVQGENWAYTIFPQKSKTFKLRKQQQPLSIDIKQSSKEIDKMLKINEEEVLILKIDVEGAEYDIFDDLCASGVIEKIDLIFGEAHDGLDSITEQLSATHTLVHKTKTYPLVNFIFEKKGVWQ